MKKNIPETRKYRLEMNDKILNSGFRDFNKFFALDNKAYIEGALYSYPSPTGAYLTTQNQNASTNI